MGVLYLLHNVCLLRCRKWFMWLISDTLFYEQIDNRIDDPFFIMFATPDGYLIRMNCQLNIDNNVSAVREKIFI